MTGTLDLCCKVKSKGTQVDHKVFNIIAYLIWLLIYWEWRLFTPNMDLLESAYKYQPETNTAAVVSASGQGCYGSRKLDVSLLGLCSHPNGFHSGPHLQDIVSHPEITYRSTDWRGLCHEPAPLLQGKLGKFRFYFQKADSLDERVPNIKRVSKASRWLKKNDKCYYTKYIITT